MNIEIKSIPHKKQRYETCGDYFEGPKGKMNLRISHTNDDYDFLIALHELIEWKLTQKNGISIGDIDAFDKSFEKKRKKGNFDEPGNDPEAPYHNEHMFATYIEKLLADELGIDWDEYEKVINNL